MAGQFVDRPLDPDLLQVSDEHLALRYFELYGDQFASRLSGAFVIAIWNRARNQVIVTNDRFGLYPLYYSQDNRRLIFAPEVKGIFCDPDFHKEPNLTALAEYVRFQFLLGEKTFFEKIQLLPASAVLCYDLQENRLSMQSYWDFSQIPALPKITFDEAVEEAGRLLSEAIRKLTQGNYRYGIYLSGGLDSRAILGYFHLQKKPLTTITFGKPDSRDVVYARRLARKVASDHHYFPFQDGKWVAECAGFHLDLTEGFHSWIHQHGINILSQARQLIDVNISGFAGQETNFEDEALLQAQDEAAFTSLLFQNLTQNTTWPSIHEGEARLLFTPRMAGMMSDLAFESFRAELAKFDHLPYALRAGAFSRLNPDRRMFQYYLVFHRSQIEMLTPFSDYAYMDFIFAIPHQMLFHRKLRKALILKSMPSLAGIPYDKENLPLTKSGTQRIAHQMIQRGKSYTNEHLARIFPEFATLNADYENWLRTDLRAWGEGILLGKQTLSRDIFNPEFLKSLWDRHQSGLEENFIGKIAPIMTWEMLMRRFYDPES
jgi:asparagine synthase (glutamine-hydrolysing)